MGEKKKSILSGFVSPITPLLLHFKMCYHLCLDCLPASGEINTHAALLC